jgi:hypothetical protein
MSESATKHAREQRRLCERCRDRKAKFQYRGTVRADRDHTLCFECFRAQREHHRAMSLFDSPDSPPGVSPFGPPRSLNTRQAAHRQTMLEHFERSAGRR